VLIWLVAVALFAGPLWERLPPAEWTDEQLASFFRNSPWVSREEGAHIYLASARPVREAEVELRRRKLDLKSGSESTESEEYFDFIRDNGDDYIVLAVHIPYPQYLLSEKDTQRMENRCQLVVGKKNHKLVGHFPPTAADRYLRLVFPKVVKPTDVEFTFKLYVPGVPSPFRMVTYRTADLAVNGSPEL
jgi:hypothetical protein